MKLLPTACALFLLSAPLFPRLAAEDDDAKAAAAAVNVQDVDAIIAAIPRRDEALKPKLAFYDRLRQEYEAKTKDAGAAKTAGAAAISAFARVFAGERERQEFDLLLIQLTATKKAGAKDPLLELIGAVSTCCAGSALDDSRWKTSLLQLSQEAQKQYGHDSVSGLFALLSPLFLAANNAYRERGQISQLQAIDPQVLFGVVKSHLLQVKPGDDDEQRLGELWFWAFVGSSPKDRARSGSNKALVDAFAKTNWPQELGDRPFARWLTAQQAHELAWKARGGGWASEVSEADMQTFAKELERAISLLPPDDRSEAAIILRNTCGGPIGRVRFDEGLRQSLRQFWSPACYDALRNTSFFHCPRWGGSFALQLAHLRPYLESAARQQRWDLCERLVECLRCCADGCSKDDPFALGKVVASEHEWLAPWLAAARQGLSTQAGVKPDTLAKLFSWQLACTEEPKTCRELLLEESRRSARLIQGDILSKLLGSDWKGVLAFRRACGHPLIGSELAAIGRDDPKSLIELRSLTRQFKQMAKDADDEPMTKAYLAQRRWRYTQSLALMEGKTVEVPPDELGWISPVAADPQGFLRPAEGQAVFVNLAALVFEEGVVIEADLQVVPGAAPTRFGLRNNEPGENNDTTSGLGVSKGALSFVYRKKADQPTAIDRLCAVPEAGIHPLRMTVSRQGYSLQVDGLLMSQDSWELRPELALHLGVFPSWEREYIAAADPNASRMTEGHCLGHVRIRALKAPALLACPLDAAAVQGWEKDQSDNLGLLIDSINQHLQQFPQAPIPFASLSPQTQLRLFATPVYRPPFTPWLEQQLKPRPCMPLARPAGNGAWTAQANSEENASYHAANLIDGNYGSLWHSNWTLGGGVQPLHATLDLLQPQTLEGVRLSRRTDSPNGTPVSVFVQTSLDSKTWSGQRCVLAWQNGGGPRDIDILFPSTSQARYLRVSCYGAIACLAEVVPLAPAAKAPPGPSTNP